MSGDPYPIPGRLNLCLGILLSLLCLLILWGSGQMQGGWGLALLAAAYAIVMNTGYALIHEAEHDMLHPDRRINDAVGAAVTLFFPASFHLRRQGHVGHHLRNRTDDEAFDLYFDGENPVWKHVQFYGILTGFFWLMIVLSNIPALLHPAWLARPLGKLDRPTAALQETLNPRYFWAMRLEAAGVFLLHGGMILFFSIPFWNYFFVLCGFGFVWSTLQYLHHYGTERDVAKGALNVRVWKIVDWIWLHHHWHLNHHLHPNVPWIYLPRLTAPDLPPSKSFWSAYWVMWRGPRYSSEHLENRSAGKLVH